MALEHQLTGMTGVYLAAAELSHRGFIVSPTSRSARGANLLVTDQSCHKAWSVQVKTNANKKMIENKKTTPRTTWSLNEGDGDFHSESHIFVFVNLKGEMRPDYMVVPSSVVSAKMMHGKNTARCHFNKGAGPTGEGWELFGDPRPFRRRRLPQAA